MNTHRLSRNLRNKMGGRGREITVVKITALPCLAHSHFQLFLPLKKHLAGQKFHEDEKVKNIVTIWLQLQAGEFCDIGIKKLVPRLNKCLDKAQ
jgi:hypothetical protein